MRKPFSRSPNMNTSTKKLARLPRKDRPLNNFKLTEPPKIPFSGLNSTGLGYKSYSRLLEDTPGFKLQPEPLSLKKSSVQETVTKSSRLQLTLGGSGNSEMLNDPLQDTGQSFKFQSQQTFGENGGPR